MRATLITRFMLLSIGWLVLLLPLWYFSARWFAAPVIWLAGTAMNAIFAWTDGWAQEGVTAVLFTLIQVRMKGPQGDVFGELTPEASYPTYGYGLVLLWAMMLASHPHRWWLKGLVGTLILMPAQAWGIAFQWLRDVVLLSGANGGAYIDYSPLAQNGIAYGYQFGFLMLPTVLPILLWLLFNKRFVAGLWLEAALDAGSGASDAGGAALDAAQRAPASGPAAGGGAPP